MNFTLALLLFFNFMILAMAHTAQEFSPQAPALEQVRFSPYLLDQINAVLDYYAQHGNDDLKACQDPTKKRVETLMQLENCLKAFMSKGEIPLEQLQHTFKLTPIGPSDRIRLTRYVAFSVKGRPQQDELFNTPLLDLPSDERLLPEAEANLLIKTLFRFRYTKQEILAGALPPSICKPLVWLMRGDFEDAQLQGSVAVQQEEGGLSYFNVSRNNGRPYQIGVKQKKQSRYSFFKNTVQPLGYGLYSDWQIPIFPYAALAGDVQQFGLGLPILLQDKEWLYLAILSDTGGAFINNAGQLDFFLGTMADKHEFKRHNRQLPNHVSASFLQ